MAAQVAIALQRGDETEGAPAAGLDDCRAEIAGVQAVEQFVGLSLARLLRVPAGDQEEVLKRLR